MRRVLLQAWKFVGKGDYFDLLEVALRPLLFLKRFLCLLPLFVLGEDLPAYDVGVVLRLQDLIFQNLRSPVMLGAVEMRQLLDKLIDILLVGCVDPPISEQLGVEERFFCGFGVGVDAGFEYFQYRVQEYIFFLVLHAHLPDLPSYFLLLLSDLEHDLWQLIGETDAFLAQFATALKLKQVVLVELRDLLLIDVPLRLVIHTEADVFYFHSTFVVPQIILGLARQPGFGSNALVAVEKHRSLQIEFYKQQVKRVEVDGWWADHCGAGMKFQWSWRMDFMCWPLQASLRLWCGSVKMRHSEKMMFLPILVISVSSSTSSPSLITLRNSVEREMEIVRMWVIRSMLIVVRTSTIVANAPPWIVYWMFFWCGRKVYLYEASLGLSSWRSKAINLRPKSSPNPPCRCGFAQQSFTASRAVRIVFIFKQNNPTINNLTLSHHLSLARLLLLMKCLRLCLFACCSSHLNNKLYCFNTILYKMEQQLILSTIEILPATMEDVLAKLQALLASPAIEQEHILVNIIKSLFYGVWNFDKMINQHNLNTKISELLLKLPKKNAIIFLRAVLQLLYEKWNLIDHHRINKFMQLVRYLIGQSFKFCEKHKTSKKKIDAVLHECIFDEKLPINGLVFHVIDIYFELCQQNTSQPITLEEMAIFEELLVKHTSEHVRLYIAEHVYEKYKDYLIQTYGADLEQLEQKVQDFSAHFLELAKKEEKELHRKNLYAIVGYAKSEELSFAIYLKQRREKALAEQQKKKKKLTKAKKQQIRQLKQKRKSKKKGGKKTKKIMSAGKFQAGVRTKKGIEEL